MDRMGCTATRDPIPALLAESLWLGGEAMVVPATIVVEDTTSWTATDRDVDPSWLVI